MIDNIVGYGKSYASFGEIVQGRLRSGDDFLVTLPVNMWSTCEIVHSTIDGESIVECMYEKSKQVAERMLVELEMTYGSKISITFTRNIPIGKGLSSSTADMLATVRAFQEIFGAVVTENFISRLFSSIEPHDGLQYFSSIVYNHREGVLLNKLNYIPQFNIVGIDGGGVVDTEEYNSKLSFSSEDLDEYEHIYQDLLISFANRDDESIAKCSTRSSLLHIKRNGNSFFRKIIELSDRLQPLGVLTTHSGTCVGLLYPIDIDESVMLRAENLLQDYGEVFNTRSLRILL